MFKYKITCSCIDTILFKINQIITNDSPCRKSFLGEDLYEAGIHFQECDEKIKGFYLSQSEKCSYRNLPVRMYFDGEFIDEAGSLFFDVKIYPRMRLILLLLSIFILVYIAIAGKVIGIIIDIIILLFFGLWLYDMAKDAYKKLSEIFNNKAEKDL